MLDAKDKIKLLIADRPWETEPDYEKWKDKETGYICEVKRSPFSGALCGYVTVPKKHHYYGEGYNDVPVHVHGGLTYSNAGTFGFDCAHAGDLTPKILETTLQVYNASGEEDKFGRFLEATDTFDTYRTFEWVKAETTKLAKALKDVDKE